jgi:hypothetical protein
MCANFVVISGIYLRFAPDPMSGVNQYIPDTPDNINTIQTTLTVFPDDFSRAMTPDMSDTHFTALDWRPSAKRATYPRQRAYGGQKQAPAAFLAAAKRNGLAYLPRCNHCGRVAMRGLAVCRFHGGGKIASRFRPYVKSARRAARAAQAPLAD